MDQLELSTERDIRMLSKAVRAWYSFYQIRPDEQSTILCSAAINLFNDGYRSADEIASILIETYAGQFETCANAPSSASIH